MSQFSIVFQDNHAKVPIGGTGITSGFVELVASGRIEQNRATTLFIQLNKLDRDRYLSGYGRLGPVQLDSMNHSEESAKGVVVGFNGGGHSANFSIQCRIFLTENERILVSGQSSFIGDDSGDLLTFVFSGSLERRGPLTDVWVAAEGAEVTGGATLVT